ncbi:MAG: hypothetical protein Q7T55_03520 [Solirubrobacteraceae bacterium]|nr:hypothetical protein [Solirubrobacteraceae bacterium]
MTTGQQPLSDTHAAPSATAGAARGPWAFSIVAGAVIVVASVVWWLLAAPRTTSSAVASLVVRYDASGFDGALIAPIMVGAAWTAGLIPAAFVQKRVAIAVAASVVVVAALVLASSDAVVGDMATTSPMDIAAMPLPPHALPTWAALVMASVVGAAVLSSAVGRPAVARGIAAAMLAAYAVVTTLLVDVAGGIEGYGFAALTALAGIWLAVVTARSAPTRGPGSPRR